ncbi:MAG TPA: endo-1,4-beta-xylanase [Ignavibacteriaceae bacterium]|nr:endo-1,4-beta-xylanase [Ignavibacteriaceae bacterium]
MKLNFTINLIFTIALLINIRISPQPLGYGYDKFIGNAYDPVIPASFDAYWNQITPGNSGKWGSVEGSRDVFSWSGADGVYNYAKQKGFSFKWHNLIWGQQQPGWISALPASEQLQEIEEWISAVGQRYPEIDYVDVVNEPLNGHNQPDGGNGRANYKAALGGNGSTGWDWVIKSFELARQYIPNAKLLINDYGIINDNTATTNYLTVINLLKDRGLIDGIGVQGHRFELMNAPSNTLKSNLDRLAATGLPIYISELDLGPDNNAQPDEALQLSAYQRVFPILWEHPGVKGITFWGYIQGQMWQVNTYLVRSNGTETPAMQWLRNYLSAGKTRSAKSGNWNDVSVWEVHDGTNWVPASNVPSVGDNSIIISANNTITVTESYSIDQLLVSLNGKLVINKDISFSIKNGDGTDLTVNGTLQNFGSIIKDDSAEIKFTAGASYMHELDGGLIPLAVFRGSTILFDSIKTTLPSNANQDFYNVVWNCPAQSADISLAWNGNTIGGNITVISTGTGRLYMCGPQTDDSATVNMEGDVIQSGGEFSANGTGNGNTRVTINHSGNINVTGGNFSISRGTQGGTGTTTWNLNGNFLISNAATENSNPSGAKFLFTGTQVHNLTIGEGNTMTALPVEIDSGAILNMGTSELKGSGIFRLQPGATLYSGHPDGLNGNLKNTGTITLSNQAGYGFSGTASQVTGDMLPEQVENLILNNNAGITLSKSVTVNGMVDVKKEGFSPGAFQLIYGPEAALSYSGATAMSTSDIEFPAQGGPKNLIIDNSSSSGITLHASRTIAGNLLLSGKFRLGDNNFTASAADKVGTTDYAITDGTGSLILTDVGTTEKFFPVGATGYAPVWITNSGDVDTVAVRVEADLQALPEGGRVRAKWILNEAAGGGGNYTLKFGWAAQLEDGTFRKDRAANAGIFLLGSDTTEAGSGSYTTQFTTAPYSVSRGGITSLGSFGVGKFGDITAGVDGKEVIPSKFNLSQNYPNPFNPTTQINYSLAQSGYISLKVFNLLGQEVATLFEGFQQKGNYSAIFEGSRLATGIYIYRLTAGNFTDIKKAMLLK